MKILITGGAGFIGGNFIHYILKKYKNYKIICVDKLTYAGNLSTLNTALESPNLSFFKTDITDKDSIFSIFENEHPDIVINFAAESHVDRSIKDPQIFTITNIVGTQVLMDACREYSIQQFHQISTDEVYGDFPLDKTDLFFTESMPLRASSPYSASKASADLLAQAYYKTFKLPITISRSSNNYGPYQFPEKLIPLTIVNALNGLDIPIYGVGKNIRDWIYVEDHCKALDLIIHKGKVGEVYNIGAGNEKTNLEIVNAIIDILGKGKIQFVQERPGHDLRYALNSEKIKNNLGWEPKTSFETGLKQTIKWYLDNKKWWEDIMDKDTIYY
ncbi:MAG TPA: dTDP-glucose 4,6-dehydratase [Clostridiales bacterium]|nr:dTDP-glucose 4,6-dehydratase [Clostridiales bacterium]